MPALNQIIDVLVWYIFFPIILLFIVGFFLRLLSKLLSLGGNAKCEFKDCKNRCDDLISVRRNLLRKDQDIAYCRQHALMFFLDTIKSWKFLFFKPYPKSVPTSNDCQINNIRIDNYNIKTPLKYGFYWGNDQNQQETVFNRIKSHIDNLPPICKMCSSPSNIGYYEDNQLTYPDGVSFEKVINSPTPLCFNCFSREIQTVLNTNVYKGIIFDSLKDQGNYIFYFWDPKAKY